MAMACWNGINWECNANVITYLESLTTSFNMDTENNADKEGKSPTEVVGISPVEVSFSTTYRVETGTHDIKGIINMWKSMIGAAAPLIIGTEVFGADMMQLQSVSFSNIDVRNDGTIRAATVSFKFKEYIKNIKKAAVTSTKSSTSITKNIGVDATSTNTAISVGPSKWEKERKKQKRLMDEELLIQ